jgi:hypothetical protein
MRYLCSNAANGPERSVESISLPCASVLAHSEVAAHLLRACCVHIAARRTGASDEDCAPKENAAMSRLNQRVAAAVLSATLLGALPAATGGAASAAADPVTVLQRMFDAQNSKDLGGVLAVMTEDFQQDGGACNVRLEPTHCESKAAFVKAFGPPDTWPRLQFTGSPRVDGDTVTGTVEARFDRLPELFRALRLERVLSSVSAKTRGEQLYYVQFAVDRSDAQTASFVSLVGALPARDGRTIFQEPPSTQVMFAGTWGTSSSQRWATEHDAELQRLGS